MADIQIESFPDAIRYAREKGLPVETILINILQANGKVQEYYGRKQKAPSLSSVLGDPDGITVRFDYLGFSEYVRVEKYPEKPYFKQGAFISKLHRNKVFMWETGDTLVFKFPLRLITWREQ